MLNDVLNSFLEFIQFVWIVLLTLPRDLSGLIKLIHHHTLLKYNNIRQRDFIAIFRQNVQRYPSKRCFVLDERTLSFQQVRSNDSSIAQLVLLVLGREFNQSISEFLLCRRLFTW